MDPADEAAEPKSGPVRPDASALDGYFGLVKSQYRHLVRAASQKHGPGVSVFEFFARAKPTGENCRYQYREQGGPHWEGLAPAAVLAKYDPETTVLIAVGVPVNDYNNETRRDVRLYDLASGDRILAD